MNTDYLAEIERVNKLTVKFFSLPQSKQNFTNEEKALLRKYGVMGKAPKSEYATAYTALS